MKSITADCKNVHICSVSNTEELYGKVESLLENRPELFEAHLEFCILETDGDWCSYCTYGENKKDSFFFEWIKKHENVRMLWIHFTRFEFEEDFVERGNLVEAFVIAG